MHRLLAALLAATACASIAQAQTASPVDPGAAQPQSTSPALIGPSFTVDRALELAGLVSPSLEAATADIRAAEAGRRVAGLRPHPSVMVVAAPISGSGPYSGTQRPAATTSLTPPIQLGGTRTPRTAVPEHRPPRPPPKATPN